jgi:hypothetical protein
LLNRQQLEDAIEAGDASSDGDDTLAETVTGSTFRE